MIPASRIAGVVATIDGTPRRIIARRGVVLAAGGFARDLKRLRNHYPHLQEGGAHFTPVPAGNTGDGIAFGETAGGRMSQGLPNAAAWVPVSKVPSASGAIAFPHLVDRYQPGFIMVGPGGLRFVNESLSYHDVGAAMIETCRGLGKTEAWLIADHRTIRKYGIGFVKPSPMPLGAYLHNGHLKRSKTLADLAAAIGVPAKALEQEVVIYNQGARQGEDRQFERGTLGFNRYLGDAGHQPNPNVAPVKKRPVLCTAYRDGRSGCFSGSSDRYAIAADGAFVQPDGIGHSHDVHHASMARWHKIRHSTTPIWKRCRYSCEALAPRRLEKRRLSAPMQGLMSKWSNCIRISLRLCLTYFAALANR